jgi:hypothetical protein
MHRLQGQRFHWHVLLEGPDKSSCESREPIVGAARLASMERGPSHGLILIYEDGRLFHQQSANVHARMYPTDNPI